MISDTNAVLFFAVVAGNGVMCRPGQPLRLTEPTGNIANVLTEETRLGSADCPWMIQVQTCSALFKAEILAVNFLPGGPRVCLLRI